MEIKTGTLLRCVDASVRKPLPGALISDMEKRTAGYIEVMEILSVRDVGTDWKLGDAPVVWLGEIERSIEIIRRYRAKSVVHMDRPFFLDRFVVVRDRDDLDDQSPTVPSPREKESA